MRHGRKVNHLGRKSAHRKAMLSNMATSLILHKRIKTTLAKAKALRKYVEPLITRSKTDDTHNRRMCFRYLRDKDAVTELFGPVSGRVGDRPGGYTRIIKLGKRFGDAAEMCIIELVDFNEVYMPEKKASSGKKKSRRRRGGTKKKAAEAGAAATAAAEATEAAEEATDAVEEVKDAATDAADAASDAVEEAGDAAAEATEE